MSDFGRAVTALEMSLKALQLDGKISVQMDSETERIVLDEAVSITRVPSFSGAGSGNWVTSDISAEGNKIFFRGDIFRGDLVEAVTEAVVYLVAKQARDFLGEIFEAVEDEDGLGD